MIAGVLIIVIGWAIYWTNIDEQRERTDAEPTHIEQQQRSDEQ